MIDLWRGGRAAEGTGLLNRRSGNTATEGSNPSLSALKMRKRAAKSPVLTPGFFVSTTVVQLSGIFLPVSCTIFSGMKCDYFC